MTTHSVFKSEQGLLKYTVFEITLLLLVCIVLFLLLGNVSRVFGLSASILCFAFTTLCKILSNAELGNFPLLYILENLNPFRNKKVSKELGKLVVDIEFITDTVFRVESKAISILEIYPVNFFYYSPETQRTFLDSFRKFLNSIDFPMQILCITCKFDMNNYIRRLMIRCDEEDIRKNYILRNMVIDYILWLKASVGKVIFRRYFIVVSSEDLDNCISEINRKVTLVKSFLGSINIRSKILGKNDIIDIFRIINNRRVA